MPRWRTIEELSTDVLNEYKAEIVAGGSEEAAIVRASALLAVHHDDIADLRISYGLTVILLRSVSETVGKQERPH